MWSTKLIRVYFRNLDVLPVKRYISCPRGPRRNNFLFSHKIWASLKQNFPQQNSGAFEFLTNLTAQTTCSHCYNKGGALMDFPTVRSRSVVYFIKLWRKMTRFTSLKAHRPPCFWPHVFDWRKYRSPISRYI